MLRDNLAGLIAPMFDSAEAHRLVGSSKQAQTEGCSRSTELTIVAYKRSWSEIFFQWNGLQRAEAENPRGFGMTSEVCCSRAAGMRGRKNHRTIDPLCLENPRPEGAESTLTGNPAYPFPAEPTQDDNGYRVLPAAVYMEHTEKLREYSRKFTAAIGILPRNSTNW